MRSEVEIHGELDFLVFLIMWTFLWNLINNQRIPKLLEAMPNPNRTWLKCKKRCSKKQFIYKIIIYFVANHSSTYVFFFTIKTFPNMKRGNIQNCGYWVAWLVCICCVVMVFHRKIASKRGIRNLLVRMQYVVDGILGGSILHFFSNRIQIIWGANPL